MYRGRSGVESLRPRRASAAKAILVTLAATALAVPVAGRAQSGQAQSGQAQPAPSDQAAGIPGPQAAHEDTTAASDARAAVGRNPLIQRMRSLAGTPRWQGGAKGSGPWMGAVLKGRPHVPFDFRTRHGVLRGYATADGALVWVASGRLRDQGAILRLGDLLPLLKAVGIDDRQAALAVTEVRMAGGAPPSYTLTFRTGALHRHRAALARAEAEGRAWYSLATGEVTVMGALVLADGKGDLHVKRVSHEGDQRDRLASMLSRRGCEPIEAALRSTEPKKALSAAEAALKQGNVSQACAARYFAVSGVPAAAGTLRTAMRTETVAWSAALVEALVHLEPEPTQANLDAVATLLKRRGAPGAQGVCESAATSWLDALLAREDLDRGSRAVLDRCAW